METAILKEKRNYSKEKINTNKSLINTMIPSFYYKNKKGEIIAPKTSVCL